MGDRSHKSDPKKLRQGGANPFDSGPPANSRAKGTNAVSSPNPFDGEEEEQVKGNNPFKDHSKVSTRANPFDSADTSSNPFDDQPTSSSDMPPSSNNPFEEPKQPNATKLTHSESKQKIINPSPSFSSPKSPRFNPFDEETNNDKKQNITKLDLHMVPPRESRSSSVAAVPCIEGEVSCVILASCTGFQVMKNPKEHAVYTLTITATLSMKNAVPFSWSVKRRNKQFETLHAGLAQTLDISNLPALPKKTWTRALDPVSLESRRQAFDKYIQAVIQDYGENTIVCTWLCDSFHKMLLPFLHKQMEDRVTTDQLRHHLSAAVIREHELEQTMEGYKEREHLYGQKLQMKESECVNAEKKSEEYRVIGERAFNECDSLRKELHAQKQEKEALLQQMAALQEELEQTQKKLKEKPPPPPPPAIAPTTTTSLVNGANRKLSVTEPPPERKLSVPNNPFDEMTERKPSISSNSSSVNPSLSVLPPTNPLDPTSVIESLDKPLFEPQQSQWTCTCSTENKLPIVQCTSCRLVKPLSFPIELTITNIHKVQRSAKEDPFAEYLLQVKLGTFCYLVRRRYSDFEKLYDSLVAFFGKMDTMPSLPKAQISMFGGGNSFEPAFLQQRRTQLQTFLHGVVKHSLFFHCGPLCGWLVLDSVDGLFGPLLRAAVSQRSAAESLAGHVRELEATVSTKTQLLVETLELRNQVEEALETEKAAVVRLTENSEKLTLEMQEQQRVSLAEIARLQSLLASQTQQTQALHTELQERVAELALARKETQRITQEASDLSQRLSQAEISLQGEKAAHISLEQQLESALNRSTEIARELAAAEARSKLADERVASNPTLSASEGRPSVTGVTDEYCVVSPPLSPTHRSSSPLVAFSSIPSSPDTVMALPNPALDSFPSSPTPMSPHKLPSQNLTETTPLPPFDLANEGVSLNDFGAEPVATKKADGENIVGEVSLHASEQRESMNPTFIETMAFPPLDLANENASSHNDFGAEPVVDKNAFQVAPEETESTNPFD